MRYLLSKENRFLKVAMVHLITKATDKKEDFPGDYSQASELEKGNY